MQEALQTAGPGARAGLDLVSGPHALGLPTLQVAALRASFAWLHERHRPSVASEVVGPNALEHWVVRPLDLLADALPGPEWTAAMAALRGRLNRELLHRELVVVDLWGTVAPERWWFTTDASEVAAVDDGEEPAPVERGLPEVDLILVVLARRQLAGPIGTGRGHAVVDLLANGWRADEREALGSGWSANGDVRPTTLVLVAWLHRVAEVLGGPREGRARTSLLDEARLVLQRVAQEERAVTVPPTIAEPAGTPEALAVSAVSRAADRTARRARDRTGSRRTVLGVLLGVGLWMAGVWGIDPASMTDLGLLSILRPIALAGLVVLLLCLCAEIVSPRPATWRLAAPVVALVAVFHGTPAVLYPTLRYSWAWKHLGILDYIHRHGSVDSSIGPLGVYHNWPGFFSMTSALADLFGLHGGLPIARWWPLAANLAVIPVLLFVYRGLRGGDDRRTAWLAVCFFLVSNWIGQDYFSPQSLGFLLYLVIMGVVLQFLRANPLVEAEPRRWSARWGFVTVLVASGAIVTSHQITPFMLMVALTALTITGQARTRALTAAVFGMAVGWSITGAFAYMRGNVAALLQSVGAPVSNADGNLVNQGRLSSAQVLVSTMGRVTVAGIALVAVLGLLGSLRRRSQTDVAALILLVAPATLVFANSFGGEIGFRSYLFALPFLSWYAARLVWPPGWAERRARARALAVARGGVAFLVAGVLLTGFLFGYYGKDRWYAFTKDEVVGAQVVFGSAPPNSLLVTISADYAGPSTHYEDIVYVPIASEPPASRARLLAHPADVLSRWLSDPRYTTGYVLVTRSQEAEVEALGALPRGSVARIRAALDASPRFRRVFSGPDAQVYVLAPVAPK